ncbi:MAG: TrkH family potassium uptake protein [Moorellales bacterium]
MFRIRSLDPPQVLALGFAGLILVGSLLLSLPWATESGRPLAYLDALFTATSATAVTGLTVVHTRDTFSLFGELVILGLIQIGGLGLMTVATLVALTTGRRISLRQRVIIQEALGENRLGGIIRLTKAVLAFTALVEGAGALLLAWHWAPVLGWGAAMYYGLFHAVSAFCNAGFDLFTASLEAFRSDWLVNLVVSTLFVVGGLGFHVVTELASLGRWHRLSLHTRMVLLTTLILIGVGTLGILSLELRNPATLAGLPWPEKVLASYFQAVTPRTAGFSTLPIGQMREPTLWLLIGLMFVGASPGSTGGGIKTTTFATLLATVVAILTGKEETTLLGRRLGTVTVFRAMAVTVISMGVVALSTLVLLASGDATLGEALFESTSAFGTVGLSQGITPDLSTASKLALIATMFVGRVGPLTLGFALMHRLHARIHLPEEKIMVG